MLFQDGYSELTELEIPGGSLTLDEQEDYGYQIYTLEPAMAPGDTLQMRFATERVHDGFSTRGADTRLVKNGTFLNNAEFAPQLARSVGITAGSVHPS